MSDLMKKWELARYLLDAKKSIDTLLYVAENSEDVSMIDIQELVNEIRRCLLYTSDAADELITV